MFRLRIVAIIRELQYYKDRRPAYRMSVNGKYSHITFYTSVTRCAVSLQLCIFSIPTYNTLLMS